MIRAFELTRRHRRAGVSTGTVIGGIVVLVLVLGAGYLLGSGGAGLRYDAPSPETPAPGGTLAVDTAPVGTPAPATPTARDRSGGAPPITFDPVEIDFGTVLPDTDMDGTFTITNISDKPLEILAVKPDCKCTTVGDLAGKIIPPGQSIEAAARMEGPAAGGTKTASIGVLIRGYEPAVMRLRVLVGRAVKVVPYAISPTATLNGELVLTATDERPFTILASNGEPPTYVDGFAPGRDEPRTSYRINYDLSRWNQQSCVDRDGIRMPVWWIIETDHPDAPILDLHVRHPRCSLFEPLKGRKWILSRQRVILDDLEPGEPVEFSVYLKWLSDVSPDDSIREVRSESDHFDAELVEATRVGDKITCRVKITPRAGYDGLFKGDARFYGFLAGQSQGLRIIGRVDNARREQASR